MKQVKIKLPLRALTLASGLLLTVSSFAQTNAVKGHVKDASGEPIMGATITVNGKAVGITDMDGNFSVDAAPGDRFVALENTARFEIGREFLIAFSVLLLGDGDALEGDGDLNKAFFAGGFGESGIQVAPFVLFASGGGFQIL